MKKTTNIDVDDDWLMAGILHTLQNSTDSTTTSELKNELNADSTKPITYRLNKLEKAGYVDMGQVSMDEWEQSCIPPITAELTPDGREFAEQCDLEGWDEPDTIPRRIDRLETIVDEQQALINDLLLATGVQQDQTLPDVLLMRAGYSGVDDAISEASNGDVDVNEFVAKWASDEFREIDEQLD